VHYPQDKPFNQSLLLKELAGSAQYLNGSRNRIVVLKEELTKTSAELIAFLKTEYSLE